MFIHRLVRDVAAIFSIFYCRNRCHFWLSFGRPIYNWIAFILQMPSDSATAENCWLANIEQLMYVAQRAMTGKIESERERESEKKEKPSTNSIRMHS